MDAALIEHDPDFWFADGSVVIIAEGVGFRVHMSLLSRHSPVFRDIFAVPQPAPGPGNESDGGGSYQGVPIVHVSERAHDMRCLLHAIYDGRRYLQDMTPNIPFAVLAALMRLSHKYELTDVMNEAAKHLKEYFTTDLDTWLDYQGEQAADLFECVNLARLTGKPAMLPTMLYMCCQLGIGNILRGSKRRTGVIERLSEEDTEICVIGYTRLLTLSVRVLTILEGATCATLCKSPVACSPQIQRFVRIVHQNHLEIFSTNALSPNIWRHIPFAALVSWSDLCSVCHDGLVQKYRTTQRRAWNELPSVFCLEQGEVGDIWAKRYNTWNATNPI
ncbi:uncharacterized protein TRAVEDRAFT_125234 [Trametes versicolor FP-101664 SS1]|uniref:uncharacterized protein n=1 Tax=Trametes versicolor (strain FP-101664) TaxID=717944 RepID=UPI0004621247|nr:uncharacterized protein TRAVEDRAFT_125234 [Trametes versicolor FP-101664 SS1]EIW58074.1 hypothetical protein TRAVEDRAFT_125234 [Trametes versicolor FP-101664 SS1]